MIKRTEPNLGQSSRKLWSSGRTRSCLEGKGIFDANLMLTAQETAKTAYSYNMAHRSLQHNLYEYGKRLRCSLPKNPNTRLLSSGGEHHSLLPVRVYIRNSLR